MIALAVMLLLPPASATYKQPIKITTAQAADLQSEAKSVRTNLEKTKKKLAELEKASDWRKYALYWSVPAVESPERTLASSVEAASEGAVATKKRFDELSVNEQQKEAADVLFADIRTRYGEVYKRINLLTPGSKSYLKSYSSVRDDTLSELERNALAYEVVAADGAETFDLDVVCTPPHATVSYKRRGDPLKTHPDPTDTIIENLVYATWTVHAHKDGFKDQEKDHDPFREKHHLVHFDLEPEK